MSWIRFFRASFFLVAAAMFFPASLLGQDDKPRPKKPGEPVERERERQMERQPDLSPEENERLRRALSQAWETPEVIRTREAVRQSTEEYRKALRNAVREVDPEAVELMGKLHEKSKSQAIEHRLPPKVKGKGGADFPPPPLMTNASPVEIVEWVVNNEPGFRPLEPEHRRGLMGLAQEVAQSGVVNAELETVRQAGNPKDSAGARMRLRQKLFDEMAARDPGFRQLRANLPEPGAPRPKGPAPGGEPRPERPPVELER